MHDLITPTEASRLTGVPRTTIITAIGRGEIKTRYVGGVQFIRKPSLEAWSRQERKKGIPKGYKYKKKNAPTTEG